MTAQPSPAPRPRRGLAEKRAAIASAACAVFGRDGYTRAGIDAIAKEADVSTRTIYNHFPGGKEQLFATVIHESASRVAAAQCEVMERHLGRVVDLEADLAALGLAWVRPLTEFSGHFALVRQVIAEAGHLPPAVLADWRQAGPEAVQAELARHLGRLADQGLLVAGDPDRAARHFILLVATEITNRTMWGLFPLPEPEVQAMVAAGVRDFLRLHGS
ncbi:TetR/AcrR family transcriptional regulator [Kitasatospora sp. HPMI-4]|uniref:TetR/AcrR family transcriptional regulator n=1 Tax=Kitasatospora sp. HPMI-4 TaxID=3448443 RepID=UPI003F1B1479